MSYEMIKRNYDRGLWTEQMVRVAVRKGLITKDQFRNIVKKDY